jgi:hypothetical protein
MGEKKKTKISVLHIVLLSSIFVLLGFYLFSVNSILKEQFTLKKTAKYADELKSKNENLKNLSYEAQSLDNLGILSRALDLEEVRHVSYIELPSGSAIVSQLK